MDDASERWLPVIGYEGYYEGSDLGRVRSLRRRTASGFRGGRTLKARPNPKSGHLQVHLSVANIRTTKYVHQLVAAAFIGKCPPGREVRHLDGDTGNNTAGNLIYGTRSENNLDAVRHGTHSNSRKTHCKHGHKFTPENTVWLGGGRRRNCLSCKHRIAQEVAQRAQLRRKKSAAT
jgi:hypothetical protein